jgi:hypothetical protein
MIARLLLYFALLLNPWQQPMGYGGQGAGGYTGPTISNVQTNFCTGSVTSCAVANFSPSPASGNLIFVAESPLGGPSCSSNPPTDTLGNSFGLVSSVSNNTNANLCTFNVITSSSGTDAVNCHSSAGGQLDCWAALVTASGGTITLDTNCKNTNGSTTVGSGTDNMKCNAAVTPAQGNELYIGYANDGGTNSNGSLLKYYGVGNGIYYQQTTAATITPAATVACSSCLYTMTAASYHK